MDVYTLPEGDVVLQWPDQMSVDSLAELKVWTDMMLAKFKRQTAEVGRMNATALRKRLS